MTAADLLQELEQQGCQFKADGDWLRVRGLLTDELRELIRQHKPEITTELQRRDKLFPYPLAEHLLVNGVDPMDLRYINGKWVHEPGWWKRIPRKRLAINP